MSEEQNIRTRYASLDISNAVFYIPFAYLYRVRLGTVPKLLSWMLIYLMPTAFYSWLITDSPLLCFAASFLLLLLAVFSLYEWGYIHNDAVAVTWERNPSVRLYEHNMNHFRLHRQHIFLCRLTITVSALSVLLILHKGDARWVAASLSVMAVLPLFMLYNRVRSRSSVWIYPLLVFSRYLPFIIPYLTTATLHELGLLYLSFPMLNALERFSMPRHRFPVIRILIPNEQSKTVFRVAYYVVLALLLTPWTGWRLMIPVYILGIYRILLWIITRFYTPKNYLQG